ERALSGVEGPSAVRSVQTPPPAISPPSPDRSFPVPAPDSLASRSPPALRRSSSAFPVGLIPHLRSAPTCNAWANSWQTRRRIAVPHRAWPSAKDTTALCPPYSAPHFSI